MSQEFDEPSRTHINRDEQGTVRDVLHLEGPFRTSAPTAQLAAQEYLRAHQALLGLSEAELGSLALEPEPRPIGVGPQLRFSSEKAQFDTTTVTYAQTCLALPVWEAGVSVQMRRDPLQVVSAQSTAHRDIGDVPLPASTSIDRLLGLSVAGFSRSLGLSATDERFDRKSLEIERRDLYIYRYEADMRTREPDDFRESGEVKLVYSKPYVNPDLPSVPAEIVSGRHYVV
ncbi:MAG TPA: hypothetical protein VEJ84_09655, partial [Acidimicrobiales bacterium]|nr:hypothetical protein [Acidimicrobiales bacterium]